MIKNNNNNLIIYKLILLNLFVNTAYANCVLHKYKKNSQKINNNVLYVEELFQLIQKLIKN